MIKIERILFLLLSLVSLSLMGWPSWSFETAPQKYSEYTYNPEAKSSHHNQVFISNIKATFAQDINGACEAQKDCFCCILVHFSDKPEMPLFYMPIRYNPQRAFSYWLPLSKPPPIL